MDCGCRAIRPFERRWNSSIHHFQKVARTRFIVRRKPLDAAAGFARMVERTAAAAKPGFKAHPHMLRHACGYALANKGHDTRALAGLSRPPQHSAHGPLYGTVADAVQGFLAGVSARAGQCPLHLKKRQSAVARQMAAMGLCVQPVSATPLAVYRLAFGSPRSFADVD